MPTHEITRSEWKTYLDEFSKARAGELVTAELVFNPQDDPQIAFHKQPLVGISYEEKGSEAGTIELIAGGESADSVTHTITQPVHIYHKNARGIISDEVNIDEILEITSAGEPRIISLRFEPA